MLSCVLWCKSNTCVSSWNQGTTVYSRLVCHCWSSYELSCTNKCGAECVQFVLKLCCDFRIIGNYNNVETLLLMLCQTLLADIAQTRPICHLRSYSYKWSQDLQKPPRCSTMDWDSLANSGAAQGQHALGGRRRAWWRIWAQVASSLLA